MGCRAWPCKLAPWQKSSRSSIHCQTRFGMSLSFSLANTRTCTTRDLLSLNGLSRLVAFPQTWNQASHGHEPPCIYTTVTPRPLESVSIMQNSHVLVFRVSQPVNTTIPPLANELSHRLRNSIVPLDPRVITDASEYVISNGLTQEDTVIFLSPADPLYNCETIIATPSFCPVCAAMSDGLVLHLLGG